MRLELVSELNRVEDQIMTANKVFMRNIVRRVETTICETQFEFN